MNKNTQNNIWQKFFDSVEAFIEEIFFESQGEHREPMGWYNPTKPEWNNKNNLLI